MAHTPGSHKCLLRIDWFYNNLYSLSMKALRTREVQKFKLYKSFIKELTYIITSFGRDLIFSQQNHQHFHACLFTFLCRPEEFEIAIKINPHWFDQHIHGFCLEKENMKIYLKVFNTEIQAVFQWFFLYFSLVLF